MERLTTGAAMIVVAIVTAVLVYSFAPRGTSNPGADAASSPAASGAATADATPITYVGQVSLDPDHGPAGTAVTMTGSGFGADTELAMVWHTVSGAWVLGGDANEEFHGRQFDPATEPLGTVTTDASGAFTSTFTAPLGFGFNHDVTVEQDGRLLNKAGFSVDPTVSISPESGPVGTPITVRMEGVGWANLENSWELSYDNAFTGLLSSVTTGGVATAVIPASGAPGLHIIRVVHGSMTVPYLNMQQSPRPDRPTFKLSFTITDGPAVLPPEATSQGLAPAAGEAPSGGPAIWTDPVSAQVGTSAVIHGTGFTSGASVALTWYTVVGNRVGGGGWQESASDLANVTADAEGSFDYALSVPNDLGGAHRIEASVAGTKLAETKLTITPSAFPLSQSSGPAGTDIIVHLNGVGWTETANIYTLNYDNGYLGYACGFNSQGDVVIHLPGAGAPGWHFIDLYPAIYKGTDVKGVQNFRIPQLTFADDHPGEQLPAFHFAFEVTP